MILVYMYMYKHSYYYISIVLQLLFIYACQYLNCDYNKQKHNKQQQLYKENN